MIGNAPFQFFSHAAMRVSPAFLPRTMTVESSAYTVLYSSSATLAAASSLDKSLRTSVKSTGSIDGAKAVGKLLAERAKAAKVQAVVFDRGGRMYHGRVKALAEASREGGLKF